MVRLIRKKYKKLQTEVDQSSDKLKELKAQKKQVDDEFGQPISQKDSILFKERLLRQNRN